MIAQWPKETLSLAELMSYIAFSVRADSTGKLRNDDKARRSDVKGDCHHHFSNSFSPTQVLAVTHLLGSHVTRQPPLHPFCLPLLVKASTSRTASSKEGALAFYATSKGSFQCLSTPLNMYIIELLHFLLWKFSHTSMHFIKIANFKVFK